MLQKYILIYINLPESYAYSHQLRSGHVEPTDHLRDFNFQNLMQSIHIDRIHVTSRPA